RRGKLHAERRMVVREDKAGGERGLDVPNRGDGRSERGCEPGEIDAQETRAAADPENLAAGLALLEKGRDLAGGGRDVRRQQEGIRAALARDPRNAPCEVAVGGSRSRAERNPGLRRRYGRHG